METTSVTDAPSRQADCGGVDDKGSHVRILAKVMRALKRRHVSRRGKQIKIHSPRGVRDWLWDKLAAAAGNGHLV